MITKIDAAEVQLKTAIRLFFENRDHLSSYTLAIASREVTDDLIENRSDEIFQAELARLGDAERVRLSFREEYRILIKPKFYKDALVLSRRRRNFLKHADKDPGGEMEDLTPKELALTIMFSVRNLGLLGGRLSREMTTFLLWLGTAEPHLVKESSDPFALAIAAARKKLEALPYGAYDDEIFEAVYNSLTNDGAPGIFGKD
jgi:hypothetical protein